MSSASATNIPNLLGVSTVTTIMNPNGEPVVESSGNPNTKYIIIGCVVGGAVLIAAGLLTYFLVKKMRASNPIEPQPEEPSMEKIDNMNIGDPTKVPEKSSMRPIMNN